MIKDLQELGKWLNENNQVDFGKNVHDDDCIFTILYDDDKFKLGDICFKKDFSPNYSELSCFNNELYHSSNQNIIIPSTAHLLGFSPFFIKIGDLNKFENKVVGSIKANENNKNFSRYVNYYFEDFEGLYLNQIPFDENQKKNLRYLFKKCSAIEINELINKYYDFVLNNVQDIINEINKFKENNNINNDNFYLACIFGDCLDLINDFFYFHSKFLHKRSKEVDDFHDGICSICGNSVTTYAALSCYNLDKFHSFNFQDNVKNSHFQVCRKCNSFIKYADEKLKNILNLSNILIIPKLKGDAGFDNFLKIANKNINSFEKLNLFLSNCKNFNFDLIIYQQDRAVRKIKKYVENYSAFLVTFENLYLYDENKMRYIGNEIILMDNNLNYLKNTFDFEQIFKEFFFEIDNDHNIKYPNFNYFYEIYITKDNFKSKTKLIFLKYSENIFNFIYELNFGVLNKKMVNEIVLNSIGIFQKNVLFEDRYKQDILKRLNYYFMIKKEFLSDNMLFNDNVISLKKIFGKPNIKQENNKDVFEVSFDETDENKVKSLIKEDLALKYYLLGQFISYIDGFKKAHGKKGVVFSNFVSNVNRNNIKKLFITEILQKNDFYINKMNKKGKFIFKMFELESNNLFDEGNDFDFEDYLLLLFTGYYAQDILPNKYNFKEELN